jgi:hypothetical protein
MRSPLLLGLLSFAALARLVGEAAAAPPATGRAARPTAVPAAQKAAPKTNATAQTISFAREVVPLMLKYCGSCHGEKMQSAGIGFHSYKDPEAVVAGRRVWERASRSLAARRMPPKHVPQPTDAERALLTTWIDTHLSTVDCAIHDPGRVTMRRLNRAEYNNTIRDLLGVDMLPADTFPSDDVGYGFDNIGDVLSISPLLMERYLDAAERIARRAIQTGELPEPEVRLEAERIPAAGVSAVLGNGFRGLYSEGRIEGDAKITHPGAYLIRVRAYEQHAGDASAQMALLLDGELRESVTVTALQSKPQVYEYRARLIAGTHPIGVAYTNDFNDRTNPDPEKRKRNLFVDWIELIGPLAAPGSPLPESHRKLIEAPMAPTAGAAEQDAAATKILRAFARRAYRRPVTDDEVARLVRYVGLAREQKESFEKGIQLGVQAALVSPHFLFKVELNRPPTGSTVGAPLTDHELACRLSYFLWSTMPDETLFSLADRGLLRKPEILQQQATRMLRDPRATTLVDNFASQWLNLRLLKNVSPDPARFPAFNDGLRTAMQKETELFFGSIIREDRSVLDLLDAKYTFLNEPLARLYGINWVQGENFRKVMLKGDERGGILTHASILTLTSNPTRTSPVKRGKWVLEQLLGTPPPLPPPNVPELKVDRDTMLTGTLREKMEQHRVDPACANCHAQMDAIGFGLENYDAVGAWRTKEGHFPVDASGTLPDGRSFKGPSELIGILKSKKTEFTRTFTQQLMTFALGRGLEYYDRCSLDEMTRQVAGKGYRFSALVAEIVKSEPFRMRRGDRSPR